MNKLIILILFMFITNCTAKASKYQVVADKIIDNLKTQHYGDMGIKNDTIIDINKDGIIDTIEFSNHFDSYKINDSIYYSLHVYGRTVLEEIDNTFYIYDVFATNSDVDPYTCGVVFEIQKDFGKKQVIEFKKFNEYFVTNKNSVTAKEIEAKYLIKEKLLKCELTDRVLSNENAYCYGYYRNGMNYEQLYNQLDGEFALGLDTVICIAKHTANRSPYSTTYMRLHSADTTRFKELNKQLSDWKRWSEMKAYYDDGILVIYEHGWENIDEPYRMFVVDLKSKGKVEIMHFYNYDFRIKRVPYFDPKNFTFEEEVY